MRYLSRFSLILVLLAAFVPLMAHAQSQTDTDAAKAVLAKFVSGDFAGIYDQLGDQVKSAVSADQLGQAWKNVMTQQGAFQKIADINAGPIDHSVVLTLQFEKGQLNLLTAFDADGKIVGLRFLPAAGAPTQVAPTPTYANPSAFTETPVTVGDLKLRGTITMPNGTGPFPAVVLIAGSGAEDQDETIGPNKPFRDIAWGLAAQGIATIRFDKRTYQPKTTLDIAHLTVKEEYIDDSVAAIDLISQTQGINPAKVFILGHSEGGYVLPRIAQAADGKVAGLIIASGLATSLPEAILRQTRYLLSLREGTPEAAATEDPQITAIESLTSQIDALTADSPTDKLILGAAPAYWLDLKGYDPVALAASLPQPILVLQGARDYQVTVADELSKWQSGLARHADTTFKIFPDLNHILVTGTGMSTPAEYDQPGNVASEVIDAVAAWVKAH